MISDKVGFKKFSYLVKKNIERKVDDIEKMIYVSKVHSKGENDIGQSRL